MNKGLKGLKYVLLGGAWLALFPLAVAAQMVAGGPKPIPRPDGPYTISGKIVNGMTGAPVPGAEIAISSGPQGLGPVFEIAESGADGGFRFNHLPDGKYTLKAQRRGYAPQALLQHENYWSGVAVGAGKDSLHVRFAIYPSAVIMGQVTDENGEGVRDAAVKLWKRSFDNGRQSMEKQTETITDDRGIYRFDHLPAGKYAVSVRTTPWYSAAEASEFGEARSLEEESDRVDFSPQSLRATVANNESVVFPIEASRTKGLPDLVYPPIYYPRGSELAQAGWFELQPGEEESADFQLSPIPGLRMVVRYNAGEQEGFPVLSTVEGDGEQGQEESSEEGKMISPGVVEFTGLVPGKYRINTPGGEDGERRTEDLSLGGDSEFDFRQSPAAESKWTIEVQASADLGPNPWGALVLRDEAGRTYEASMPLGKTSAMIVSANADAIPIENQIADHPMTFHPALPGKGVYDVELRLPVGGSIESLEATGAKVSGNRIAAEDGDVHLKMKISVSQFSLAGTAKKNGLPFAGAMMLLLPENGGTQQVRRDQSDTDGTFTLLNVVPGKYKLLALEHGWEMPWADAEQQKELLKKGMAVEIGKNASAAVTVEVQ